MLESIAGIIILLGILVFVHEFGHFIVAKMAGIKVLKFSLGFPPAAIKRKWGETEYILSWIPLGGYVRFLGDEPDSDETVPPEELHRAFNYQPLWARFAVVAAGPLANYLAAIVFLCFGGYLLGWPELAADLGKVMDGSPASEAGLKTGDVVSAIDGKPVGRWDEMRGIIEKSANKPLTLTVTRDGSSRELRVTPQAGLRGESGEESVGRIGVTPSGKTITTRLGFFASFKEACLFTYRLTVKMYEIIVQMVRREVSLKTVGGPIMIAQATGQSLKEGPFHFILVLSLISINLAIINLLPVPILDGGHLLFFTIEGLTRKPVRGKIREIATHAGLLFIIFLMVLVFYNDITRVIKDGWTLKP
jgi:regulator of sigma E protease